MLALAYQCRLRQRSKPEELDDVAKAFQPHLASIIRVSYKGEKPPNQEKLFKVLQIWIDKGIYTQQFVETLRSGAITADKV